MLLANCVIDLLLQHLTLPDKVKNIISRSLNGYYSVYRYYSVPICKDGIKLLGLSLGIPFLQNDIIANGLATMICTVLSQICINYTDWILWSHNEDGIASEMPTTSANYTLRAAFRSSEPILGEGIYNAARESWNYMFNIPESSIFFQRCFSLYPFLKFTGDAAGSMLVRYLKSGWKGGWDDVWHDFAEQVAFRATIHHVVEIGNMYLEDQLGRSLVLAIGYGVVRDLVSNIGHEYIFTP